MCLLAWFHAVNQVHELKQRVVFDAALDVLDLVLNYLVDLVLDVLLDFLVVWFFNSLVVSMLIYNVHIWSVVSVSAMRPMAHVRGW